MDSPQRAEGEQEDSLPVTLEGIHADWLHLNWRQSILPANQDHFPSSGCAGTQPARRSSALMARAIEAAGVQAFSLSGPLFRDP